MNPHSRINDNNNRKTKANSALPMAGIIVAAALLSGLLTLVSSSYQQTAMAQPQNMTGAGGGATTDNATSTMGGAAQGGNATTAGGGGAANQSTSDVRMNIEQARMALQNNDTQSAMMYLDMALSALGDGGGAAQGNMTNNMSTATIAADRNAASGSEGEISVGSTSGAEEDNTDDDATAGNDNDGGGGDSGSSTDANRRGTDTQDDSECGGVTVGGTSAADDYGCPPDPDY